MTTETEVVDQEQQDQAEKQEAAEGFSRGFQKASGTAPAEKVATTSDEDAERKAQEDSKAKEEADAKAAAEAKAKADADAKAVADREKLIADLPKRLSTIEGHIGGIKSKLDTALTTAKAATEAGKSAPTQTQVQAATTPEKWKKLQEDFPQWAEAFEERLASERAKAPAVDVAGIEKGVLDKVQPLIVSVREAARDEGRQLARIDAKHDNWEETIKTPEFGKWLKEQSAETQALADSDKANDAIKLLDTYADYRKALEAAEKERLKKEKRLAGAVTPQGTSGPKPAGETEREQFNRGFKKVMGNSLVT